MTKTYAIRLINRLPGMVARSTGQGNEIRVNYRGGKEDTAYYTDDPGDAVDTARFMLNNPI